MPDYTGIIPRYTVHRKTHSGAENVDRSRGFSLSCCSVTFLAHLVTGQETHRRYWNGSPGSLHPQCGPVSCSILLLCFPQLFLHLLRVLLSAARSLPIPAPWQDRSAYRGSTYRYCKNSPLGNVWTSLNDSEIPYTRTTLRFAALSILCVAIIVLAMISRAFRMARKPTRKDETFAWATALCQPPLPE
jgi:hypothetical protein